MGLQAVPAYIASAGFQHPATLDRNLIEGLLGDRQGAFRYGQFVVSTGVGTRAVQVSTGRYHVIGTENAQQGGYFAWSDTVDTFLLAAGVGNPRIDTLLLRIHDNQYGTIPGTPGSYFEVVQGVAAGSPTARPNSDFNVGGSFYVPGAWARIADCRVNVGDTSIPGGQIANVGNYVRHNGWTICASTVRPSDPVINDRIYEFDTTMRRRWNGSVWEQCEPWTAFNTLGATTASVTFSSIPTTLKTVRLTCTVRQDNASVYQDLVFRIGGDTGSNYRYAGQFVQNVTPGGFVAAAQTSARIGFVNGTLVDAGTFTTAEALFQGWNSPHANNLTALVRSGFTGVAGGNNLLWHGQATYHGSNAYTSITIFPIAGSFIAGSQFVLEGWE